MKKWLAGALFATVLLALVIVGGVVALYAASQRVPEPYRIALEADVAEQAESSEEMLEKAAALAGDVERAGQWQAIFSADEINAWLAVDLPKNHPDMLPHEMSDPRVAIQPGQLTFFCRFDQGQVESVLSLSVDAYLAEPNVLAIRVRKARAGALPLPLDDILDQVTAAAHRLNYRIRWRQTDGDPVALVSLPTLQNHQKRTIELEDLRLGDGELYVSGSTERRR